MMRNLQRQAELRDRAARFPDHPSPSALYTKRTTADAATTKKGPSRRTRSSRAQQRAVVVDDDDETAFDPAQQHFVLDPSVPRISYVDD